MLWLFGETGYERIDFAGGTVEEAYDRLTRAKKLFPEATVKSEESPNHLNFGRHPERDEHVHPSDTATAH
jgi:hypothetical protein